jgi:hypothetical protein
MTEIDLESGSSVGRQPIADELRAAVRVAADTLESSAEYVRSEMMPDFLAFVRRHPAPTLLLVGGLGLVLGLIVRRD